MIEWTFEVDSDIYEEAQKILKPMGKTVEEACLESIYYCVVPGNREKLMDTLGLNKMGAGRMNTIERHSPWDELEKQKALLEEQENRGYQQCKLLVEAVMAGQITAWPEV